MKNIQYINLKKDYSKYVDKITSFYKPRYEDSFSEKTLENTAVICLAMLDGEIVGAVRAISDLSRHSLVVDLVVAKDHRRKGIGTNLTNNIVSELSKETNRSVGLVTDPKSPWLKEFYIENGYKELVDSYYLEK